jgi:dihydrodipicolinate synthase/N-acetylneuraminate lyase
MARTARQLRLSGIFAAAITPHRADFADPDYSGALDLLDFLAAAGVQGITLLDTPGEFLNYTFQERQRLVYLGVKRSRVPILAGVSHSTLVGALELAGEAIAAGADGLLIMPPYFFEYAQPEVEEFLMRFARETGDAVPILLHNDPRVSSPLEIETLRRLAGSGRFAGIKDAGGDWNYFESLLGLKKDHTLAVFAGDDRMAAQALKAGADGVISAAACAVPEWFTKLPPDALEPRLNELLDWFAKFPDPVALKRAVRIRGQKAGLPLNPLAPETARALEDFAQWFKQHA